MPTPRPTTIPAYIDAAPAAGRVHLRKLYATLQRVAVAESAQPREASRRIEA